MASLGVTPYAENNGVIRLELTSKLEFSLAEILRRRFAAVPGREPNDTDDVSCGSCFDFPEAGPPLDLGRSSMRRRLSLIFFCLTVGRPMFMLVVYTSRVMGKALLAPIVLTKECATSAPAV